MKSKSAIIDKVAKQVYLKFYRTILQKEDSMNILIVEDDKDSATFLQKTLLAEKQSVVVAYGYQEAKELLERSIFSLILLDWNLGDGSGYELLQECRNELAPDISIIMITSENDTQAVASALDIGADDYITKPYSMVELLARIRAVSRREVTQKSSIIKIDRLQLNTPKHTIYLDDTPLDLTVTEYDLLQLLMQNPNIVLTRYQLNEAIMKDFASFGNSNLVDVHIKNIRKKIGKYDIIKTVRGIGYTIKTDR